MKRVKVIWRVLYLCRKGGYLSQGETGSHSVSVPTSSSCVAIGNGQYRDATKPGTGLLWIEWKIKPGAGLFSGSVGGRSRVMAPPSGDHCRAK